MFSFCCSIEKRSRSQLDPVDASEARQSLTDDPDASFQEESRHSADEDAERERREQEAREQQEEQAKLREAQESEARKQRRAKERQQQIEAEEEYKRRTEEEKRRADEQAERSRRIKEFQMANGFGDEDVNQPKTHGCCKGSRTYPLHLAAKMGDEEMVRMILQAGAYSNLKDSGGKMPEAVAKRCNKKGSHDGIVRLLKEDAERAQAASDPIGHEDAC